MTLPRYALKYEGCTLAELQRFIKDRHLRDICESIPHNSKDCIVVLRDADDRAAFRWTDLIGGLRYKVYDNLLTCEDGDKPCHPQILATSKAINKEATSILYESNIVNIRVHIARTVIVGKHYLRNHSVHLGVNEWPTALLKIHQLRVMICGHHDRQSEVWILDYKQRWPEILMSLCSFLRKSTVLRNVVLERSVRTYGLRDGNILSEEDQALSDLLYPFSRLISKVDCAFEGFEHWPNLVPALQSNAKKRRNLHEQDILDQGDAIFKQLQLCKKIRPCLSADTRRYLKIYNYNLTLLVEEGGMAIMCGEQERRFELALKDFHKFLDSLDQEDLRSGLKCGTMIHEDVILAFREADRHRRSISTGYEYE